MDVLDILKPGQRRGFFLLLALMTGFGFVEAFTYSIIVPYLNVILDPDRIFSIQELQPVLSYLGWTDPMVLVVLISVVFLGVYSVKVGLHLMVQYYINKYPMKPIIILFIHLDFISV